MRRIIAFILCMTFAFSLMMPTTYANQFSGADNSMHFEILLKLGILDDDFAQLSPDKEITRGEFSAMAARAFSAKYKGNVNNSPFADVTNATEYAAEILNLYQMGIVTGEDNYFYPERTINANEAVTILLKLLGYAPMAEQDGGYPFGYITAAHKTGISKFISDYGAKLTGKEAVSLLYAAMTVDKMESNYNSAYLSYEIKEDSNIFYSKYSLSYGSGIVTATETTSLTKAQGCIKDMVVIDGNNYYDPGKLAESFLGYRVDFLYVNDKDNNELEIYSVCASIKNSTAQVNSEDIRIKNDRLYDDSTDNIYYEMDNNIYVIKNGKFISVDFGYDWMPDYGYVKLIDNDNDGVYEVAVVKEFDNYVVSSIDKDNEVVYDIYHTAVPLTDEQNDVLVFYKNGVQVSINDVNSEDVISVCKSDDGDYVEVYISTSVTEGIVTETYEDKVLVNDVWYDVAPSFNEAVTNGREQAITLDTSGKFLLDFRGSIAHVISNNQNGLTYGYIMAATSSISFVNPSIIRVFNQYGDTVDIEVPDKVKVDEQYEYTTVQLLTRIRNGNLANDVNNQLIKYRVNKNNELKEIYFAQSGISSQNTNLLIENYTKASRNWRPSSRSFNGVIGVSTKTIVMVVPSSRENINDKEAYKASTLSYFANDEAYSVAAYDCSEADVAKILLITSDDDGVQFETPINVFEKVTRVMDADGAETYKLSYWERGAYKETIVKEEAVYNNTRLEYGDAFRLGIDYSGKIAKLTKILDMSNTNPVVGSNPSHSDFNRSQRTVYGSIVAIDGTNLLVKPEGSNARESHSVHDTAKQTKYIYCDMTAKDEDIRGADFSYLQRCVNNDSYRVLIRTRYCYVYEVLIYKIK